MKVENIDRESCKDDKKSTVQTRKAEETQISIYSSNGVQLRDLLPLKPPKLGYTAPADIRTILLRIVKDYRRVFGERDDRIGKEIKHVLKLKNDEEIIDKILSMSNAKKLKDLHRLVDGRGYNWKEFKRNNESVARSDDIGVYLIAAPLRGSQEVKLSYVGYTNSSLRRRCNDHRSHPIEIKDDETGIFFLWEFHCTALLRTTRTKLKEDDFIKSLQKGLNMMQISKKRKRDYSSEEESISYFLKTVEAIFIGLYFTCQTCQWFNIRMQNCMPYATKVVKGLNIRPSLAQGEIGTFSKYIQNPRLEEEEDNYQSKTDDEIREIVLRGTKELRRRSIFRDSW